MSGLGRALIYAGLFIAAAGVLLTFAERIPFIGRLPGDIYIKKENVSFYFPLATSLLLSAIASLVLWFFRR